MVAMNNRREKVNLEGPKDFTGLTLKEPQDYAAGLSAVKIAMGHAMQEMGLSRSISSLSKLNQKGGFDCPGCAWPDPDHRSKLGEFCENGVKAIAEEATTSRVDPDFFARHSIAEISQWSDLEIGKKGRLTTPMLLQEGEQHYRPVSWEDAFELIAKELKALDHPDQGIFYTSGRSSNEAAFLYGLMIRAFGTNNMPDCSNMCHESSGVALNQTLGIGKGSVSLDDFEKAEVVMVMGQNPGTNHPRMLSALEKCRANGGKVVAINPIREAALVRFINPQSPKSIFSNGSAMNDLYLQIKINQDVSLLKLVMKKLARLDAEADGVFDHDFIKNNTRGFESFLESLDSYDSDDLLEKTGLEMSAVDQLVQWLAEKKRIIICWAMGLTQHKNGVENIKECVNLLLAKGSIGKAGSGTCPVRGHSNVQGDRSVGITHHVSKALNEKLKQVFDFDPPEKDGLDVVGAIKAMHDGAAKVFVALGGNFASAASDTLYTGEAIQKCELTVYINTKLNRSHCVAGKRSLILPTLGRTEKDVHHQRERQVTVENSMGRVHRSGGVLAPASSLLRSETDIIGNIAMALFGEDSSIDWQRMSHDYDEIRHKIAEVFDGYEDYSHRSKGGGFDLPNHTRVGDFSRCPGGKASFSVCALPQHHLEKGELLLMTIRSHDQFNTTIYGLDDRYRGVFNERRVVLINQRQMDELGLHERETVDLLSSYRGVERRAEGFIVVPYDIPYQNAAAYFPETNVLIPHHEYADTSRTPISKSVKITIAKRND